MTSYQIEVGDLVYGICAKVYGIVKESGDVELLIELLEHPDTRIPEYNTIYWANDRNIKLIAKGPLQ